ncbi:MAG: LamG-like jellyroll fold domain-containing protein, partial [Candidatus Dormibacteria bacterium]
MGTGSQAITGLNAGTAYFLYPFWDESSSTVKFVSSASLVNPATIIPGAQFENLTGALGYVNTTTNLTRPTACSFEMWFLGTLSANYNLGCFDSLQTGQPGTEDFTILISAGSISWTPGTSGIRNSIKYNDGSWHHILGTYDGTTAFLYVDGIQTGTAAVTALASFTGWWRISQADFAGGNFVTIGRAAVYPTALTGTQAASHFTTMKNSGLATYDALVAADGASYYWKLNETVGTTAADSIGVNTGTYNGTFTLNQTKALLSSVGSPAYCWLAANIQAQQTQALQGHAPLSAGTMATATPASGT